MKGTDRSMRPLARPVLVAAAFGGLAVVWAASPGAGHAIAQQASTTPSAAAAPDDVIAAHAAFAAQIMRRPLFSPSRQPPSLPPPPPPPVIVDAGPQPFDWRVTGIMISPDRSEAIFVRDDIKLAVGVGEDIGGWTVVDVRVDAVDVEGDGGRKTLRPEAGLAVADKTAPGKNGKATKLPKPPPTLPTLAQARTGLLMAGRKSMEEEAKRPKRQLRPQSAS